MKRLIVTIVSLLGAVVLHGTGSAADKLNINTATEQDLMKLPEMTEARAKGIVGYRKSNGEFIQIDELELIPQVKPIYGKIKDLVTVE
ncbi:MAG: helix-hairpin-helix domain-containing protein [Candidatus Binatia bacterium]|jgi:DNA uptake protein ComE-like DNA-binding protein